jgi:hypothetical protein
MFCSKQVINNAGLGLQVFSPLEEAGILLALISKSRTVYNFHHFFLK